MELRNKWQHSHFPLQCWKMVKCKLVLDESVLSTLHTGGGGGRIESSFPTLVSKVMGGNNFLREIDIFSFHLFLQTL